MSSTPTPGMTRLPDSPDSVQRVAGRPITPVGVDVGTKRLAVAATPNDDLDGAVIAGAGEYTTKLYAEFCSATHRLSVAPEVDDTALGDIVARYWSLFEATFRDAAETVLTYAQGHPSPVLVLEDLDDVTRHPLAACANGAVRLSQWCPVNFQAVLADQAVDAGVPVTYVSAYHSSQECHRCGTVGELEGDSLACVSEDCPIGEVCRDRSGAVTIANRGLDQL